MTPIVLVPVGAGRLALTHRPKKKDLPVFHADGVTHVLTLLTEREGANELGTLVRNAGMTWIWCPLEGANTHASIKDVGPALRAATNALGEGSALVVHCSAGIHRSGMVGYALLRISGLDRDSALVKLREIRKVTAEGVGDERLRWGDRIADEVTEHSESE